MSAPCRQTQSADRRTARARAATLVVAAAGLALAGCEADTTNVWIRLESVTASYQTTTGTTLELEGTASMVFILKEFDDGDVATVWINRAWIRSGTWSPTYLNLPLSWVSTDRGLPFEHRVGDANAVPISFGATYDGAVADLCDASLGMDLYLDLGDVHYSAWSTAFAWPAGEDPCPADGGTGDGGT